MSVEVFGQIIDSSQVEQAVEDLLVLWMDTYLAEVADQNGDERGQYQSIRSFTRANDADQAFAEDQMPRCIITCPGFSGPPETDGDGGLTAKYPVGIAFVVSSTDEDDTRKLTARYTAAGLAVVLQHPDLGGIASSCRIEDYRSDVILQDDDQRTIACGYVTFEVMIEDAFNVLKGPSQDVPKSDPTEDYTPDVVASTGATVQPQETP